MTSLPATTRWEDFQRIVTKLMGISNVETLNAAWKISTATSAPPTGTPLALSDAASYKEMLDLYITMLEKQAKGKKKAPAKEQRVWILDLRTKEEKKVRIQLPFGSQLTLSLRLHRKRPPNLRRRKQGQQSLNSLKAPRVRRMARLAMQSRS